MNRRDCIGRRDDESHVFVCPACRTDARIAAAWKAYAPLEEPAEADERFVQAVVRRVARGRIAARRRRILAAAAAAALFAFFAGLAHERASRPAAPGPEESYAELAAPSGLSDLIVR